LFKDTSLVFSTLIKAIGKFYVGEVDRRMLFS